MYSAIIVYPNIVKISEFCPKCTFGTEFADFDNVRVYYDCTVHLGQNSLIMTMLGYPMIALYIWDRIR